MSSTNVSNAGVSTADHRLQAVEIAGSTETKESTREALFRRFPKWREAMFLTSVAGFSMLFGFGASVTSAKKQDPTAFDQGMAPASRKFESGAALAARALKWGTIYAVGGCGILFFTVWKLLGVNDLQEFRMKVGGILPRIPKNDPPVGRTEFKNLTDLLQYVIDEDEKAKAAKKSSSGVVVMAESSGRSAAGSGNNDGSISDTNSSSHFENISGTSGT